MEEQVIQESLPETQEESNPEEKTPQQSDAERNFAALRQARQKAERERDEYQRKLAEYEAQQKKEPEHHRNDDDLAEWKDIQKVKQELDSKLKEIELRTAHPDIYQVVSKDNIERLREADPELAQMIYETQFQDQTKALKMAYKFIKRMNLGTDKDFTKEKEAIESNQSKPKSSAAATRATPLSQMNEFLDNPEARRKALYKEMLEASQNR